jgi:acyl dehydratase
MAKYFDEFVVGEVLETPGRTITETEMVMFTSLSGDFNGLHTDEEFAKTTPFGTRVVHGMLGAVVAIGLLARSGQTDGTALALMSMTWEFLKPIKPGDTVRVKQTVLSARKASTGNRGILQLAIEMTNQRGEIVQTGTRTIMVRGTPE